MEETQDLTHILVTPDELLHFIHHPLAYAQNLVYFIDDSGREFMARTAYDITSPTPMTIKVEGIEKLNDRVWSYGQLLAKKYEHNGPVTCHAFIAHENAPSFPTHTDPDDVVIVCCDGVKDMEMNGVVVSLQPGQQLYIPHDTPHRALNHRASMMLSFGLERYFVDKMS